MKLSHDDMMLIIQGLRLVNGIDEPYVDYIATPEDQENAMKLLIRIDEETG